MEFTGGVNLIAVAIVAVLLAAQATPRRSGVAS
jgi:hypothetical protein